MILAHELAHLRRGDLLWSWLPQAAHMLFYFHPMVWLAHRELYVAQEMACDELALQASDASLHDYGDLLLRFSVDMAIPVPGRLSAHAMLSSLPLVERRLLALK